MAAQAEGSLVDMLGQIDLFDGFSKKELGLVRALCRDHKFSEGDDIVSQGAADKRFFLLLTGRAHVKVDGRLVREIGPGTSFGEISVLDGGPRSAAVTAATPVTAVSIASFNLRSLLKEHPSMAIKMLEALAARMRSLTSDATH
jgi:CRP/FNR family transcriptional regulator, cyclic AMP receptor protein